MNGFLIINVLNFGSDFFLLVQTTPGQWYLVHLVNEEPNEPINVIGASTGASPIVGIGHNDKIGWGITVSMVDTKDNFIEKFFHNGTYEYLGKAMSPRIREEVIQIKGQAPHVEKVIEVSKAILFNR